MLISRSRRGLALCAALTLISTVPATADAKRPKPHRHGHGHGHKANKVKAPRADWDRDGLNNRYEAKAGTSPRKADSNRNGVADGLEDRDRDLVNNRTEQLAKTDPRKRDSNHNRVPDGREDPDRDGLANRGESLISTHPRKADTDGDGVSDGAEHAGVVSAKTPDSLTIALAAGGTLVAALTEDTDVTCGTPADGSADDPAADPDDPSTSGDGPDDADDPADEGDDPADAADEGDDPGDGLFSVRSARLGQATAGDPAACLRVGDMIYQADVEDDGAGPAFTALDLLRPAAA